MSSNILFIPNENYCTWLPGVGEYMSPPDTIQARRIDYMEMETKKCTREVIFWCLPTIASLQVANFGQVRSVGSRSKQPPRSLVLPFISFGYLIIYSIFIYTFLSFAVLQLNENTCTHMYTS